MANALVPRVSRKSISYSFLDMSLISRYLYNRGFENILVIMDNFSIIVVIIPEVFIQEVHSRLQNIIFIR